MRGSLLEFCLGYDAIFAFFHSVESIIVFLLNDISGVNETSNYDVVFFI